MVLEAQEQARIANHMIELYRVRLLEQEKEVERLETAKKQQGGETMLSISLFSRPTIRIQNLQRVLPLFPPMMIMLLMMCASPSIFPFPLQDITAVVNQNAAFKWLVSRAKAG
jgi:hypothetical protein